MRYYAEFYTLSTGYVPCSTPPRFDDAYKKPIPACGDRALIIIDGRLNPATVAAIARKECAARGYIGYRIHRGDSIRTMAPVSGYWPVPCRVDNTAGAAHYGA